MCDSRHRVIIFIAKPYPKASHYIMCKRRASPIVSHSIYILIQNMSIWMDNACNLMWHSGKGSFTCSYVVRLLFPMRFSYTWVWPQRRNLYHAILENVVHAAMRLTEILWIHIGIMYMVAVCSNTCIHGHTLTLPDYQMTCCPLDDPFTHQWQ